MAAIAAITIADGKGTPLNHVFNPIASGIESMFRTANADLPLVGQEKLALRMKKVNPSVDAVVIGLELPALETATSANSSGYTAAPKVAYSNRATVTFMLPARGVKAQRTDLRVLLMNLLANPQVIDYIDNLTPSY